MLKNIERHVFIHLKSSSNQGIGRKPPNVQTMKMLIGVPLRVGMGGRAVGSCGHATELEL